ncbi:MAG: glycosyltransferase family 9 protein [Candidatus Omnitrophota bacterium]|nr:glycosyltransferase family 9 protein [Candidatus Omnitrophota bacterium]
MKLSNIRKILFITLSNIGDVILTLPVLSALKDNFPGASIDIVVGPRPEQVFKKDPSLNNIFVYDKHAPLKDKFRLVKKLRAERYDLAIDMKTSLLPAFAGARNRAGLFFKSRSGAKHKRLIHLEALKPFGIGYREQKNIYIDEESRRRVETILMDNGVTGADTLIGVSPGSKSLLKQWKKQGFIDVIAGVLQNHRCKIILTGDASETGLSGEIACAVNRPGLINLTGKINLNELFALIEKLDLFLTCDSAGMHIASDLAVPVVAIFGPTDPEEYGPRGAGDVVIRKALGCSPCKKAVCKLGTRECMETITAQEVLAAIKTLTS